MKLQLADTKAKPGTISSFVFIFFYYMSSYSSYQEGRASMARKLSHRGSSLL